MKVAYFCMLFCPCAVQSIRPFSAETIRDLVQARCGNGAAVWAYEGTLYDPLDGRQICQVEGLELVRLVPGVSQTDLIAKDLHLGRSLSGGSTAPTSSNSTTILSRKLFCYKSKGKLLESIKLRQNSPKRLIPKNQAVALYDTATTFTSRRNGEELVLHTEFPNGKCYWGTIDSSLGAASVANESLGGAATASSIEFSVYTTRRPTDLPTEEEMTNSDDGVVVGPKRSRLIQFGASPKQEMGRFGARETYSYTVTKAPVSVPRRGWTLWNMSKKVAAASAEPPLCSVKYSRYGEGPPWYGPGKYCSLELRGRRVDSIQDALPLVRTFAQELPGFLQVDQRIVTPEQAQRAIAWFRKEGIQLEESNSQGDGFKEQVLKVWKKIRAASSHVSGKVI